MFVHRTSRSLVIQPPFDLVEPIATLGSSADRSAAIREGTYRELTLGLGFEGSYLIELHWKAIVGTQRFDRFIAAMNTIDPALLDLTPDRSAALAMLDELRGLYATGE